MNTAQILFWSISLLMLVAIISVSVKVYKKQLSTQSLVWILAIVFLPLLGSLLYFALAVRLDKKLS